MATTDRHAVSATGADRGIHLDSRLNVGTAERVVSAFGGGLLTLYGLTRGSLGGLLLSAIGGGFLYRGLSGQCPAYNQAGISTADAKNNLSPIRIEEAVVIARPREEVYDFWRDIENLPRFMHHLEDVTQSDQAHSRWRMRLPQHGLPEGVGTLAWDAEVSYDAPNEKLSWRSTPDADIVNAGNVDFEELPAGRGTAVHVTIEYRPPAGSIGKAVAHALNPALSQMIKEDVRRFKQIMEAGEIPTTDGQPHGG